MVKFLNNILAQVTPFLFYSGRAATSRSRATSTSASSSPCIAAYRDLPPPVKELIDWDQQRQDVQVKYEKVAEQFEPERMLPADPDSERAPPRLGARSDRRLGLARPAGRLDDGDPPTPRVRLPARLALVPSGPVAQGFTRVLAGVCRARPAARSGGVHDLSTLPRPAHATASPSPASNRSCFPERCATTRSTACDLGPLRTNGLDLLQDLYYEAVKTGNPCDSNPNDDP